MDDVILAQNWLYAGISIPLSRVTLLHHCAHVTCLMYCTRKWLHRVIDDGGRKLLGVEFDIYDCFVDAIGISTVQ